jgi:hypothetical protein
MMRRIFFFPLSVGSVAMCLLFAGCVESAPESPPTADPFCAALAEPFCEAMYACCVDGLRLMQARAGTTVDECKKNWSHGVCLNPLVKNGIETFLGYNYTAFNPARLDACVAHLKPLTAGGYACVAPPLEILMTECLSAFEGKVRPGHSCNWDLDGLDRGTTSFVQCEDGLCMNGKCVPFLKTGDACPTGDSPDAVPRDETCNFPHGEWCKGAGDTGTCGPRDEIGEACNVGTLERSHGYECRSVNCDTTTGTCLPSGSPTHDGSACRPF